jgi:cytochrome P450
MTALVTETLTRDDETWWVTTPGLAAQLIRDPRVTARRALEPWTPLTGEAAAMWEAFKASPAGEQAASSLLATDGPRHAHLSAPVTAILGAIPDDPVFTVRTNYLAKVPLVATLATAPELDVADVAGFLPARSVVEWFGLPLHAADVEACSEQQTGLLWRRHITEAEQVAALGAAWQLRQACEAAADLDLLGSVTAKLSARLDRPDVIGILYGVSIPWVMGVKYGTLNAVRETIGTPEWTALANADLATRTGRLTAARITGEAMRRRPPIRSIFRSAAEQFVVAGQRIEAGDRIAFHVPALNAAGEEEWTFGVPEWHFCVGARIARRQVAEQVAAIAHALPTATLTEPAVLEIDSRFHSGPRRLRIAP